MQCVSLFSGCGGLDLGLERSGFKILLANDIDSFCQQSYLANWPNAKFYLGSVTDLTSELLKKYLKEDFDKVDLLAGGPPCPPYSKSRFYRKEKPRALDDPIGWETLEGYLFVLSLLQPKTFLLENVPGLAYKVHKSALDLIIKRASVLGYKCIGKVINTADYGIPQIRERFFLIGTKKGEFLFPEATHKNPNSEGLFDVIKRPWETAGAAIGDLDNEENSNDEGHFAGGKYNNLLKEIPPGDNYLYFTEKRGHPNPQFKWRSRYWSFLLKLSPNLPSWTIQARRSNNMGPFHWRNRILRIEEIKRLQTFPDNWILSGNIERQWRQIGNAVPPLMAEVIGNSIIDHINKHYV
jgi:DNA (cytosine-5)-methyltransferase 1